uniref:Uncharacterized protein n=1 Tax=Romanomermis culicivorax TaxID=13658 RepID=A0A915HYF9_ROMCU
MRKVKFLEITSMMDINSNPTPIQKIGRGLGEAAIIFTNFIREFADKFNAKKLRRKTNATQETSFKLRAEISANVLIVIVKLAAVFSGGVADSQEISFTVDFAPVMTDSTDETFSNFLPNKLAQLLLFSTVELHRNDGQVGSCSTDWWRRWCSVGA